MSKSWAERNGAVEVAPYTDAGIAYVEDHANGTGPFMLEAYEPGARTVLVRNPEWWGLGEDPHNIDRVVFTAVADPAQRMAALLAGEIDFSMILRSPSSTGSRPHPACDLSRRWSSGPFSSALIRAARNSLPRTSRAGTPSPTYGFGRRSTGRSTSRRSGPASCAAMPYPRV
jgi:hypothetical protein